MLLATGCSGFFFYPDRHSYTSPPALGLEYQDVYLDTRDGERLHAWWLPAVGSSRGTVYFLHGNAQNLSAHLLNVAWLPAAGYNVFALDYRGFGRSTGKPDLAGALIDVQRGLDWLLAQEGVRPLFLLGQSLGGALASNLAAERTTIFQAVVLDGTFAGFRQIGREKLAGYWLTWPLQMPLSWTLPADREPLDRIARISPVPLLIIHSREDAIIPYAHGERLFAAAGEPKTLLTTHTPHTATFLAREYRQALLDFLSGVLQGQAPVWEVGVVE
jgi:hypothetical protein